MHHRAARFASALGLAGALLVSTAVPAAAHEKWFVDRPEGFPTDWGFFFAPASLALVALAVAMAVAWRVVDVAKLPAPELAILSPLGRLAPWVPRLLGVHVGVSLLTLAVRGSFLAPGIDLHHISVDATLALAEGALGVWFISGFRLRWASVLLVALGPLVLLFAGPVALVEAGNLLGVAAFLLVLPPGPDRHGAVEASPETVRWATLLLRLGVGAALVVLAFSEKFANPSLARAILAEHPELNLFGPLGVSADTFIRVAAATELLFGLLVLSGAAPQLAVLAAGVPFNATLFLFGAPELLGHLPVYGAFLALLVYGSHPGFAREVRWLPTPGRRRAAAVPARSATGPTWSGPASIR